MTDKMEYLKQGSVNPEIVKFIDCCNFLTIIVTYINNNSSNNIIYITVKLSLELLRVLINP